MRELDRQVQGANAAAQLWGRPGPELGGWLRSAAVYVVGYSAINAFTHSLVFARTPITLWSPDDALSVVMLLESSLYTPLVLATSILVDLTFAPASVSRLSILLSDFIVTFGYLLIAVLLRDAFRFDIRKATFSNVIALLAVAPASAIVTGALYCGALYISGALKASELLSGLQYFWIGDAVGMIVLIPAIVAVYDTSSRGEWPAFARPSRALLTAALLFGSSLIITASLTIPSSRYLFSLMFLPTIWVGIRYGYNAVALTLLLTQLILLGLMGAFHVSIEIFASFQTQMFILAATGQLLGVAVTERESAMRDLTRQQADLARLTAQATTAALAAAFAHEISQPLSALSGYVHAARRLLAGPGGAEAAAGALQKAEAETRRTGEIVTRIREFVASGKLDLAACDLGAIASKIVALNRDEARARGVTLTLEAPAQPMTGAVDRIAIEQALNNLVVNAIEAAANPQAAGAVAVRVRAEGEWLRISVEDDGPGVADEIVDHLFEAFETTKPHGMGLGLTLVNQIVKQHGGHLNWRRREPAGAVFLIDLPIEGAAPHA